MPDPNPQAPPAQQQVNEAVSFFEQILQAMPEDRVSLEVLSQAYESAGNAAKTAGLLVRLSRVLVRDGDSEAAQQLRPRLAAVAGQPDVNGAMASLDQFLSATIRAAVPATPPAQPAAAIPIATAAMRLINEPTERRAIVTQELDFAWMLHEQNLLSEDQYASVVSDITDLSASPTPLPISVLHLFQDRQIPNIDSVLTFAAERSGVPLLPLSSFEPQAAAYNLFPLDYLVIKGIVPFDLMSADLLIATLNPLNGKLREELENLTNRRCHFYLIQPSEFDAAMDRIRKLSQEAEPPKAK